MQLIVDIRTQQKTIIQRINLSFLAFLKHFVVAGQGHMPSLKKILKMKGAFRYFIDFLNINSFKDSSFSVPSAAIYDPTAMNQFSNLAGKAIADFLVKEIDRANMTFNYEAAMKKQKMPIKGQRPDLYCHTNSGFIAVEAKGLKSKSVSGKKMNEYKKQAQSGALPKKASIASVAYNIYEEINVKYYDPEDDSGEYPELFKQLTIDYYRGVKEYIDKLFKMKDVRKNGIDYYNLALYYPDEWHYKHHRWCCPFYPSYVPYCCRTFTILVDKRIEKFAESGFGNDTRLERYEENNTCYIDSDGLGIMAGLNP
jgi:hypothetical protein